MRWHIERLCATDAKNRTADRWPQHKAISKKLNAMRPFFVLRLHIARIRTSPLQPGEKNKMSRMI